jgi:ferrous iron transport protein B
MKHTVALVGNPNSGKTTLFNQLTGSKQHVGNWPGVTIEKKMGEFNFEEHEITLVDLPGIYSMSPYSIEEVVSRDYIMDEHPDLIINIVDGTNLERNLYLSMQLKELGLPMVIAVNMMDELLAKEIELDINQLSKELNTPVVPISARNGEGMNELIHNLIHNTNSSTYLYDDETENSLNQIQTLVEKRKHDHTHDKFYSFKLLENDELIKKNLDFNDEQLEELASIQRNFCLLKNQKDIDMAVADTRYAEIEKIISHSLCVPCVASMKSGSDKIDGLLTHKYLGIPMFFVILFIIFMITFGPLGSTLQGLVETGIELFSGWLTTSLLAVGASGWAIDLVSTVIGGVGSVISFMPQIMLLFLFLSVLEDSGYMSRAAFLMDRLLRKIGLNGKAFIPMLMGFGCTVPAIMATRVLDSEKDRKMTMLLTPFMSCGARLPVYALFAGVFFPKNAGVAIFSMYVLGIVVAITCGLILRKTVFKSEGSTFILELPPYRLPSFRNTMMHMWEKAKGFLTKAGTIIFSMTVLLWILTNFSFTLQMVEDPSLSILGSIGQAIAGIFIPLGFGNWQSVISLLSGFIAKESVVSSMSVVYSVGTSGALETVLGQVFTSASAISFMVFTLLYSPCVAAIATIKSESGSWAFTGKSILFQTGVAYIVAFIAYQLMSILL